MGSLCRIFQSIDQNCQVSAARQAMSERKGEWHSYASVRTYKSKWKYNTFLLMRVVDVCAHQAEKHERKSQLR